MLVALVTVWTVAIRQLSLEWTVNPLYQYGWWVIPLAIYLFSERIPDAPERSSSKGSLVLLSLWITFIILYIPFRLIEEANFDWILLNWFVGIFAIGTTLYLIHQAGGKSWLLHFSFPVLFIFSSIPWPVPMENFILQHLMQVNAKITAAVLSMGSMEAIARGNIIEIGGQLIGVEEACSGIRSLQTSLMMSLFLGEFYRLRVSSRIGLLGLSFFLSFLFNSSRTIVLTYIGATEGLPSLESWHDPLGYGVLGISLIGLWGTAYWYSTNQEQPKRGSLKFGEWLSQVSFKNTVAPTSIVFLLTVVVGELVTEAWYRSRETLLVQATDFTVQFPEDAKHYQEETFSDITKTILKYNSAQSASWSSNEGDQWGMYLLEWEPQRVSKKLVSAHTPEICYPAAGFQLKSFLGIESVLINSVAIDFKSYLFGAGDEYFYVFHGVWEEKYSPEERTLETEPLSRKQRLETVLQGKRNLGQKILGVSLAGPSTLEEATAMLKDTLSNSIIPSHEEI